MILFTQFYNVILDCLMKKNSKRELELNQRLPLSPVRVRHPGTAFSALPNKTPTRVFDQEAELTSITRWLKVADHVFLHKGCRPLLNLLTIPRG